MTTPTSSGLYRQVVVRIPATDVALLEQQTRQHGSIQQALLAGLRSLAEPSRTPTTPPETISTPALLPTPTRPDRRAKPTQATPARTTTTDTQPRWEHLDTLAARLAITPTSLRRLATAQFALRGRGTTAEVDTHTLAIPRHIAARLAGVTSRTLKNRVAAGKLTHRPDGKIRLREVDRA